MEKSRLLEMFLVAILLASTSACSESYSRIEKSSYFLSGTDHVVLVQAAYIEKVPICVTVRIGKGMGLMKLITSSRHDDKLEVKGPDGKHSTVDLSQANFFIADDEIYKRFLLDLERVDDRQIRQFVKDFFEEKGQSLELETDDEKART